MTTPSPRTPVRLARGTKANLDAGLAATDIKEGELVYAKDEDKIYIVEGGIFVSPGATGATVSTVTQELGPYNYHAALGSGTQGATTYTTEDAGASTLTFTGNNIIDLNWARFPGGAFRNTADSAGTYIRRNTSMGLGSLSGEFTVAMWIRPTTWNSSGNYFFDTRASTGQQGLFLEIDPSTKLVEVNAGNALILTGTTVLQTDTDYHIAVTRDASNDIRLFVNGIQEATVNNSGAFTINSTTAPNIMGPSAFSAGGYTFIGFMADVIVYNGPLGSGACLFTSNFTPLDSYVQTGAYVFPGSPAIGDFAVYEDVGEDIIWMRSSSVTWTQLATADSSIDVFSDVGTSAGATDGQVLTWVDANSQWEPANPTSTVEALPDLTDVKDYSIYIDLGLWDTNTGGAFPATDGDWRVFATGSPDVLQFYKINASAVDQSANLLSLLTGDIIRISNDNVTWNEITLLSDAVYSAGGGGNTAVNMNISDANGTLINSLGGSVYVQIYADPYATDGQVLTWVNANNQWEPAAVPVSAPIVSGTPPASPDATGSSGELRFDTDYFYVCIATDTWKRAAISTWVANDAFFNDVALLLHADGTNGSTTFTDDSNNGLSLTPTVATLSTAQAKFGSASINFTSGSNATLQLSAASDALDVATSEDFTAEFFIYVTSFATPGVTADSTYAIFEFSGTNDYTLNLLSSVAAGGTCKLILASQYTTVVIDHPSIVATNQWVHVALVRASSSVQLYIDGTPGTAWANSAELNNSSFFSIGPRQSGSTNRFYMDEVRVTIGTARYTDSFTPPTEAFPNSL